MKRFLLFCTIFSGILADEVFRLQDLSKVSQPYKANAYDWVTVFASASSDDDNVLRELILTDGYGDSKTIFDLKNDKPHSNTDQKTGWITKGPIMITTSPGSSDLQNLTGLIYFRNYSKNNDDDALVYDITTSNLIRIIVKDVPFNQTVIFLNTQKDQSTKFTFWKQNWPQHAAIYTGPASGNDSEFSAIFQNPFTIDSTSNVLFSPNVEPFSIHLPYFHGIFTGAVQFIASPGKIDNAYYTASKTSTTGVIVKTILDQNAIRKVIFPKSSRSGISGFNALGSVHNGTLEFDLVSDGNHNPMTVSNVQRVKKVIIQLADSFEVTSQFSDFYYAQYFNLEFEENNLLKTGN